MLSEELMVQLSDSLQLQLYQAGSLSAQQKKLGARILYAQILKQVKNDGS